MYERKIRDFELYGINGIYEYLQDIVFQNGVPLAEEDKVKFIAEQAPSYLNKEYSDSNKEYLQNLYDSCLCKLDSLYYQILKKRPLTVGQLKNIAHQYSYADVLNSLQIEGNRFNKEEMDMLLSVGFTVDKRPFKEHLEMLDMSDRYLDIYENLHLDSKYISIEYIKYMHSILCKNMSNLDITTLGEFRNKPVFINFTTSLPPTNSTDILYRLSTGIDNYNNNIANRCDFFEQIFLFHREYESIHPFKDGNGRTGRFLMNLMLTKMKCIPFYVESAHRLMYYSALEEYNWGYHYKLIIFLSWCLSRSMKRYLLLSEEVLK